MAVTVTIDNTDATQQGVIIEGRFTMSGNYPTGGDTVNFLTQALIPANSNARGLVTFNEQPASGAAPSGYLAYLIAGSTMANWLLYFGTAVGQPTTQLGAGAYPAALLAATFQFRAFFPFGV